MSQADRPGGMNRRQFIKGSLGAAGVSVAFQGAGREANAAPLAHPSAGERPNILFAFADDWGAHASALGTAGLHTPTFDRIASEGVLFENAFLNAPSCTPARGTVLTGQYMWRLGPGANLHSTLPAELPVYPELLEAHAGYFTGYTRKGWGPGQLEPGGREAPPTGPQFDDFEAFLESRPGDAPFCFWFGSQDPHRGYSDALREEKGVDPDEVEVPPCFPDGPEVRRDIANYYAEVQRFDREVGEMLDKLDEMGELSNTLVVMSSDHGWPFPRGKSNLYDAGTHVPLAIWWPGQMNGGRRVSDLVTLTDLAPTFLEAAGVDRPAQMTGRSFLGAMLSEREGRVTGYRSFALLAKERHHGLCRPRGEGYPSRAIRTKDFLYIRNYEPDRWPVGAPYISSSQDIFSDTDDGPTKQYMIAHADDPDVAPLFALSFAKRPAEELYDMREDPHQLVNVAEDAAYEAVKHQLAAMLEDELTAMEDPRMFGEGDKFDEYPYYVGYGMEEVDPPESVKRALDL
jgi:N-sulfoglucosamine sulfohydrolase